MPRQRLDDDMTAHAVRDDHYGHTRIDVDELLDQRDQPIDGTTAGIDAI